MEKIINLVKAGSTVPGAIKDALGIPLTEFADKYHLPRGTTNEVVNLKRVPTDRQLDALVSELGGTPERWRRLLWEGANPAVSVP